LYKRLLEKSIAKASQLSLSPQEAFGLQFTIQADLAGRANNKLELHTGLPAAFLRQLVQLLGNRMEFYNHS
jgi:hypothetical protein